MRNSLLFLMIFYGNCWYSIYPCTAQQRSGVLINELLFNPRPGGVDFVEICNTSDFPIDLKEFSVAAVNDKDSVVSIKALSKTSLLLLPGTFLVLTTDPSNVQKEYTIKNLLAFLKMASMPAFNDDEGAVVLLKGIVRADQFNYSEKMHFPLIKDPEGVSLERSSFKRSANEPGNFRSAAGSAGYATPGYRNSQAQDIPFSEEEVYMSSKTFSPDNDGFEDMLELNYKFGAEPKVANAFIYNDRGILVHKLARNLTLASEGTLTWNGLNERNERQAMGIYMLYLEVFDVKGSVKKYRKSFVLARKL